MLIVIFQVCLKLKRYLWLQWNYREFAMNLIFIKTIKLNTWPTVLKSFANCIIAALKATFLYIPVILHYTIVFLKISECIMLKRMVLFLNSILGLRLKIDCWKLKRKSFKLQFASKNVWLLNLKIVKVFLKPDYK